MDHRVAEVDATDQKMQRSVDTKLTRLDKVGFSDEESLYYDRAPSHGTNWCM